MMAETVANPRLPLGWERTGMESSSDESDAYVPGVSQKGNLRPKMRARRPREIKARIPIKQPAVQELPSATSLSVQDLSQSLDERRLGPAGAVRHGPISLKDLCVEDKKRIANLIKELAKVGEEREKARDELEKERRQYEQQILQLVDQQEQILRERQEVENQLIECQNLLAVCQTQRPPPNPIVAPPLATDAVHYSAAPSELQDTMHSLRANVGSPASNLQRPVTAMIDRELAFHRYQQTLNNGVHTGYPPPQQTVAPGAAHPHHTVHNAPDVGDYHLQQQQQPPSDFFATAVRAGQPHDFLSPQRRQGQNNLPVASQGNKEEIINRFFASQTPEKDTEHAASPTRRQRERPDNQRQPQKAPKRGAFRPPIMSSTQKSAEIGDHLSVDSGTFRQEFAPLVPDDSPGSTEQNFRGEDDAEDNNGDNHLRNALARVAFSAAHSIEKHSPYGDGGEDRQYVHNYRKLTQTERKRQLLQQRTQLLEEQKRLKQVLSEQEAMLREKQHALHRRVGHHGNGGAMEAGVDLRDDDPLGLVPQRLAIDAALERQRAIVDSLEAQTQQQSPRSKGEPSAGDGNHKREDGAAKRQLQGDDRVTSARDRVASLGTKPSRDEVGRDGHGDTFTLHSNKLSDLARKLEYSLPSGSEESPETEEEKDRSENEEEDENGSEEEDDYRRQQRQPRMVEMGTSVSYRNILRSAGSSPATGDGERTNGPALSITHPVPHHRTQTPGEKTMSVLEIINSLPDQAPPHPHPRQEPAAFRSPRTQPPQFSPLVPELSPFSTHRHVHPALRWPQDGDVDAVSSSGDDDDVDGDEDDIRDEDDVNEDDVYDDDEANPELEESQILEDIFFLK